MNALEYETETIHYRLLSEKEAKWGKKMLCVGIGRGWTYWKDGYERVMALTARCITGLLMKIGVFDFLHVITNFFTDGDHHYCACQILGASRVPVVSSFQSSFRPLLRPRHQGALEFPQRP